MKSIFKSAMAAAVVGAATLAPAQALPLYESFSYSDGVTTVVSGGNWTAHSGAAFPFETTSSLSDSGASLSYPNLPTPLGSRVVGSWGGGSREDIGRNFTAPTVPNTLYVSALVKVTAVTGTGEYFLHFMEANTGNFRGRVFARPSSNSGFFNLGLRHGSGDPIQWIGTDYPLNQTVLVVLALNLVSGANNDTSSLWVNPALGLPTPPAPLANASENSTADLANANRVALRLGNMGTGTVEVDEIRVSTAWTDVTPTTQAGVTDWAMFE